MLDGAPAWTAIKPNPAGGYWAYFYNNPDGNDGQERWQDYVNAMVGHYKGKIDYWEVWNEPWNEQAPFFPGTPEQYGRLLKAAYKVAKIANPLATVLGIDAYRPIPTAKPDFTKRSLQASGSASYDAFSYHDYAPDILGDITGNVQINEAAAFYDLQREYGTSGPKPQWTTEGGVEAGVLSLYGAHNSGTDLMADQGRMVRFLVGLMRGASTSFFTPLTAHRRATATPTLSRWNMTAQSGLSSPRMPCSPHWSTAMGNRQLPDPSQESSPLSTMQRTGRR
jgi:hypothetical protein